MYVHTCHIMSLSLSIYIYIHMCTVGCLRKLRFILCTQCIRRGALCRGAHALSRRTSASACPNSRTEGACNRHPKHCTRAFTNRSRTTVHGQSCFPLEVGSILSYEVIVMGVGDVPEDLWNEGADVFVSVAG